MATRTELEAAYRATTYRVFLPQGAMDLRIDEANPAFAAWLAAEGVRQWGLLTAANPGSQPLSGQENAERQARLEVALLEAGLEPYAAENQAQDGWPAEESCLVPALSADKAMAMGRQFGQNAILLGGADGVPRLVWLE